MNTRDNDGPLNDGPGFTPRTESAEVSCPWPSFPPPVAAAMVCVEHPCMYKPGRTATIRALWAERMPPDLYHAFMDANFRRSGRELYQPICAGCRDCRQIRVPVASFRP